MDAVVVSHNSARDLRGLLECAPLRAAFDRVIVVDNASRDESVPVARDLGAEVVARATNVGFGAAANEGVRQVRGPAFALLNPDIRLPDAHVVERLESHLDDARVAVVAPGLELPDGSRQDSARAVPNPLTLAVRRWRDPRRGWMAWDGIERVEWVVGAFMIVRRTAFDAVGGFDPGYFLYFEDVDLCTRLRRAGWWVRVAPDVVAHHGHRADSRSSLTGTSVREHARSAARFYRRHPRELVPRRLRPSEWRPPRPQVVFVAWSDRTERCWEIATCLGGEAWQFGPMGLRGAATTPIRYPLNAIRMAARLAMRKPRALVVQNPPLVPALIGLAYTRVAGAPMILDSHPTSFGERDEPLIRLTLPLHAWLARRSAAVLVTVDELAERVRKWGGRGLVVHEAPPETVVDPLPARRDGRPCVLFVGVFASDEPLAAVLDAALELPDIDIDVTGDPRHRPGWAVLRAPVNVRWTGFLRDGDYADALARADIVMALTTDRTSIVRAGYEAVYARRPLVVSDTPALRSAFPWAVRVANRADAIAAGLRAALDDIGALEAASEDALAAQSRRWERQIRELGDALATAVR